MDIDIDNLIDAHIKGDEYAFSDIVRAHLPSAYNFAYRLIGNPEDAADITQESFLKAWKNLRRFKKGTSFKAWLFAIVRNSAIDLSRKKKIPVFSDIPIGEDNGGAEEIIRDDSPLPDEILSDSERNKELREYLKSIPPIYQEVITLRYDEDMSFEEIAQALGRPTDTVRSQHRRGLQALRRKIPKEI
ncbi:MAG: sigma-70 family RNA polymerase sigma factor [Candidatus Colwellbacteria bacterium]|nr:sigma-70 family RNA polymerase sigma factor [Candidatus Colwellbacteria bacterium]